MSSEPDRRPDASMTLITEMMQRPLDPGYAAAAESRENAGLPAATGVRSPLLVITALLIGALLGISALTLRAPTTTTSKVKLDLVGRIEAARTHADAQTRLIAGLSNEINAAQAAALSQASQSGLTSELSRLELAAGAVPVTGPGLVVTIDDAVKKADLSNGDTDPRTSTAIDEGTILALDVQIIVNGLWEAGAEAISVNGHRLTSRAAIRFAGAAILVNYRPLTRPYAITAIGDANNLNVEFTDNSGGSHLHSLTTNFKMRANIQTRSSVLVPGEPALSLENAKAIQSAVTAPTVPNTVPNTGTNTGTRTGTRAPSTPEGQTTSTPQTTETSP